MFSAQFHDRMNRLTERWFPAFIVGMVGAAALAAVSALGGLAVLVWKAVLA